jgi:hypothetical protein
MEDDTYSSIFKALKHPIRRRILKILEAQPSSYTDILRSLDIDNGLLNYHLENLGELVSKLPDERYILSDYGRAAVALNHRVEEPPKREEIGLMPRLAGSASLKIVSVLLLVAVIGVAGFYADLNGRYSALATINEQLSTQIADSNAKLGELSAINELRDLAKSKSDVRLVYSFSRYFSRSYETHLEADGNVTKQYAMSGSPWMYVYAPDANVTLTVIAIIQSGDGTKLPITVQRSQSGQSRPFNFTENDVIFREDVYPYAELKVALPESGWYLINPGPIIGNEQSFFFSVPDGNFYVTIYAQMSQNGERILFGAVE